METIDNERFRIERDGMELAIFRDEYDFKDRLVLAVSAARGPDMYKFPITDDEARRLQATFVVQPPAESFLAELTRRAREYGWSGDYAEISQFVEEQYKAAGLPVPNLEPIETA